MVPGCTPGCVNARTYYGNDINYDEVITHHLGRAAPLRAGCGVVHGPAVAQRLAAVALVARQAL
jgi:hypothetical protein